MIVEKILETKTAKIKQWPVNANRASELGHECTRYLVLNRTRWQEKSLHDARVQLIFDIGNMLEGLVQQDLRESGFSVIEQQRSFSWQKYNITGTIDLKLQVDAELVALACENGAMPEGVKTALREQLETVKRLKGEGYPASLVVPTEIKSAAPHPFESINSVEDMKRHKYPYMRRYPAQLTLYMLMDGKEIGLFLFKNKSTGQMKEIWMTLDYGLGEQLIRKAEAINKHLAEGTLPDSIEYTEELCGECAYAHICMPERIGKEVEISESTELLELLYQYVKLKPGAKDFEHVNERINKLVEGHDKILIGDYFIQGKYIDRTIYKVPKDIKEQYKDISKSWKKDIIKV